MHFSHHTSVCHCLLLSDIIYNMRLIGQQSYHARWVNWESTEQATTSVLIAWNSCTRSLNAMISVGQTNVLQRTEKHIHIRVFSTGAALPATQRKRPWNVWVRCYSQVQGIEEEDNVFAFVVWQLQLLKFPVNDGRALPLWSRLWNWRRKDTRRDFYIHFSHFNAPNHCMLNVFFLCAGIKWMTGALTFKLSQSSVFLLALFIWDLTCSLKCFRVSIMIV